jgi:hypothetical protein
MCESNKADSDSTTTKQTTVAYAGNMNPIDTITKFAPPSEPDFVEHAFRYLKKPTGGPDYKPDKKVKYKLPKRKEIGVAGLGHPITKMAANAMRKDFKDKLDAALLGLSDPKQKEIKSLFIDQVIYSKEALMFLLTQPDCAGIRFFYCIGAEGKPSLILAGVDNNEKILGEENVINPTIPIKEEPDSQPVDLQKAALFEVGGNRTKSGIITRLEYEKLLNNSPSN